MDEKNSVCIIIYNFTKIPEHFDLFLKVVNTTRRFTSCW